MSERIIETVGTVTKKENLASVASETHSNKLILESNIPYPGYHGLTVPDDLEPDSLFAITKIMHNDERIIRAIQAVKANSSHTFDAAPGTVQFQNNAANFIRFKFLPYEHVGEILENFEKNGIEFLKQKKVAPYETLIRVRKFFSMKEATPGIFQDLGDKFTFYIEIPANLRWNSFERITMSIKHNLIDRTFDAAQTSVFAKEGMIDFVRIYDRNCCQGKLLHIKEKYDEAIAKM